MVSKYGKFFLHVPSHSEMHLVYVYNLFDAIGAVLRQKQGTFARYKYSSCKKYENKGFWIVSCSKLNQITWFKS